MKNIICLDTETTGLDHKKDEILQLSIIDGGGKVLFHELIKPVNKSSWYAAEKIHGISPSAVSSCKPLMSYKEQIENILQNADIIVGYNLMGFDLPMLFNGGIENNVKSGSAICDVMEVYAAINGGWDNRHNGYKYKKLCDCAAHYGYSGSSWHDALCDAQATLFCFYAIFGNPPSIPEKQLGVYFNSGSESNNLSDNNSDKKRDANAAKRHSGSWRSYSVCGLILLILGMVSFLLGVLVVLAAPDISAIFLCLLGVFMFLSGRKYRRIAKEMKKG